MAAETRRARHGRGGRRRARRARRARRRGRIRVLAALAVPAALIAAVVVLAPHWTGGNDTRAATTAREPSAAASPTPSAKPAPAPKPSPSPTRTRVRIPASGPGTFTAARAGTSSGGPNAYRVEVEDGSGVDPDEAAARIAGILAAPRGWAHSGTRSFHRVESGPVGLVIRIATAATTDRICGQGGMDTHGEVNCRISETVMVNLKRWQTGSPEFDGPLDEYRALIVNHEVGHWLGHGHETCPGKGRPAPAMMQQIYGLKGCVANAWPYDEKGAYLGGPSVP
ncbi:DUF3152 domain-containing protein [Streptomyces sp. A1277]|uniref:DUF3152 domain-containing protein n=1 Tax=Streptomyces sp. A1277 TaxID=2563103 RepID=UPI001F0EBFE6|nr:DUF3152 domain-containing protein [Streptomyces sp. A1277]